MQVVTAPFPALGFDCVTPMDSTRAPALAAAGMRFRVGYLGSVTPAELQCIFAAGMLFSPVTFSRAPGWTPTPGMGTADGQADVAHLKALSVPAGPTVWIDLEGVTGTPTAVAQWATTRAAVLLAAGFDPGLYVGYADVLTSAELYALPNINRYWRSLSQVPEPTCGFSFLQLQRTITLAGTAVDIDCVQYDFKGRLPVMVGG